MVTKILKLIDKEYLQNTILNFEKKILKNKYYTIVNGKKIENNLNKIFGSDFINEIPKSIYDGNLIDKIIEDKGKLNKYFVNSEKDLPNANDAEFNAIYIVLDTNSIDEKVKYLLYTIYKDENGVKTWKPISSQSVVFEEEDIDFETEFNNLDILNTNPMSFINFDSLYEYIKSNSTIGFVSYDTNTGYSITMQYNKNNYEKVNIVVSLTTNNDGDYVISRVYADGARISSSDYNNFAQTIIDKESSIKNGGN